MISSSRRKFKKQNRKSLPVKKYLTNILIVILGVLILGFIWSLVDNLTNDDKIHMNRSQDLEKLLVINEYEKTTGHRIRVEVLNGCGVRGLADKYTNLLRNKGFDVILSGNADHFKYTNTEVILRRGDRTLAIEVALLMDVPTDNIVEKFNDLLDCDVTIIIGRDFENLPSFDEALKFSPPF